VQVVLERVAVPAVNPDRLDLEAVMAGVEPPMTERIVENLLTNADRHNPAGTPIWVWVRPEAAGVLIAVEDAGEGIAETERDAVFEPFGRASGELHGRSTEARSAGAGVGLSLVRRF